MNHPVYRLLYPGTRLLPGGKGEVILRTSVGGGCRSVTVGGATTGFGADIILIDDAMKADDIVSEARREELERFCCWIEMMMPRFLLLRRVSSVPV